MCATVTFRSDFGSPEATARFAARLAGRLRAGDTLLLAGELGAGKSHFARALIRERLNDPAAEVPSPSYTLVQTYDTGDVEIWHADLYRLPGPDEVLELGLDAAFEAAICLVEWPDRLGRDQPADPIRVDIGITGDTSRRVVVTAPDQRAAVFSDLMERQDA